VEGQTLSGAKQAVEMRLAALARTHAILADGGWTGAPLDRIVAEELTSFADQISCIGCSLALNTPAAQSFGLIIHELATNAVKHGALSRPEGHVTIRGRIQSCAGNDLFRFAWTETGGPAVEAPQRKGFGSSILSGMAKRFAQNVEVTYRAEGLIYELQVPLDSIRASETGSILDRALNAADPRNAESVRRQTGPAPASI
jgi:two-component sensor histidine kinase